MIEKGKAMTEEIKFEKAIERLEKIVEDLETGNIALEDALKKYEEGVKWSRLCQEQLGKAEKKIEVLTKTLDGTFVRKTLEDEGEISDSAAKKPRKSPKRTSQEEPSGQDSEEDFLL